MKEFYKLKVPDGYLLKEERLQMDIAQAGRILRTKGQRRYTSARRVGTEAVLTRHKLICPCCGRSTPAYRQFLNLEITRTERTPRNLIDEWANPQTSFFEDRYKELVFQEVYSPVEFLCPCCGHTSSKGAQWNTISIGVEKHKILVKCDNASMDLIFSSPTIRDLDTECLPFPLTEQLTLNLRNGHTDLRVLGVDGPEVLTQDIAPGSSLWQTSLIYSALQTKHVCRKLLRTFASLYRAPLPFTRDSVTPEAFLLMTLFRGYSSSRFFDAIPYEFSAQTVDRSFRKIVKRLHDAKDIPAIFSRSALPQAKSLKRLLFSDLGLFFYLAEIEMLWQFIEDINVLRAILETSHVYELLSFLHQCPGAALFLKDYLHVKGMGSLAFWLEHRWPLIMSVSTRYAAMSESARKVQRREWLTTGLSAQPHLPYSLPMKSAESHIKNCTIDGYRFAWLKTKKDYYFAGVCLNNCLKTWEPDSNPVIVVKKGRTYKAAIEIAGPIVLQALGNHNDPLELDRGLWKAFCKWLSKHSLAPPVQLTEYDDLLLF